MSLTKKDPSLRVAANDPHLVSLGGGRLSTAVTIHYIPIGDTTIGCSTTCSISLNGTGVRPTHCTIYRSEENEVTIVPERDARILIDGTKITHETNLTQGAMITIGNSNYLRFNNPAEAQMMRSAMGSNERISMPQIDFTQMTSTTSSSQQRNSIKSNGSGSNDVSTLLHQSMDIESFYETKINPKNEDVPERMSTSLGSSSKDTLSKQSYKHIAPIDINGLQCPKVFTADLVTVNMPAKDVLGQKYANFARNLAENHRNNDKNVNNTLRNNQMTNLKAAPTSNGPSTSSTTTGHYVNIPNPNNLTQQNSNLNNGIPSTCLESTEYLTKVNNVAASTRGNSNAYDRYPKPGTYGGLQIYPMNGVNTEINTGANSSPQHHHHQLQKTYNNYEASPTSHGHQGSSPSINDKRNQRNLSNLSSTETEHLEDMLKICTEYADRQNHSANSITSSPIVQNRIKTNGSLPRDKKSPFCHDLSGSGGVTGSLSTSSSNLSSSNQQLNSTAASFSSGYENVRLVGQNRVEINGQIIGASTAALPSKSGYENVAVVGKYVPQSPRTKIRTNCMSPKKENSFVSGGPFGQQATSFTTMSTNVVQKSKPQVPPNKPKLYTKQSEYEQLIKTFEEKLKIEMQAIEESSRYQPAASSKSVTAAVSLENSPARRVNKNINNLTLNLHAASNSLQNSPRLNRKPAPAPRSTLSQFSNSNSNNGSSSSGVSFDSTEQIAICVSGKVPELDCNDVGKLRSLRKDVVARIATLKHDISELQKQENEVLRELDMEKALVSAELNSVGDTVDELEQQLQVLQNKIHRMDAQRNAARVMEENQQAKLKQSIEMKQDQAKKLRAMLKQKPNNECLKEELHNVTDSLENDRKTFEDLEFQYLEEESEWQAYREELHAEEKTLKLKIEGKRLEFQHLEKQEETNQTHANIDAKTLKQKLIALLNELKQCQDRLKSIEQALSDITGQLKVNSSDDEDDLSEDKPSSASTTTSPQSSSLISTAGAGVMSQSLFGSAELLCPKVRANEDIMSKSVNENMFYNNKIELPSNSGVHATSTPKRTLQVVDIDSGGASLNNSNNSLRIQNETHPPRDSPLLRNSVNENETSATAESQNERVKFNLSLGSDDFEVNPLEKRVPSQDDIDRICKVTLDAPISTPKGASTKIFDSIKEIERNRQLLLAQQGHHVIEHERQKMNDLKKKCHDEARAQYLSMLSCSLDSGNSSTPSIKSQQQAQEMQKLATTTAQSESNTANGSVSVQNENAIPSTLNPDEVKSSSNQLRHSQPEFDLHYQQQIQLQQQQQQLQKERNSRPLSESNSELSCDLLSEENTCKSSIELSTATSGIGSSAAGNRYSGEQNANSGDDAAATKRSSSVNSNETTSGGSGNSDRKRALPKHQRPLTRYLPIFSPDLNLRQHIESAGHPIALCPHVFVDSYSCRGYLHKLGATFHGWARRWFVLDRQRNALIYFSDKSERKPRGGAYFSTIDEVYLDHLNASKSGRPHCTFIVKTKKRSYHLQAASDAAARIWIDAIITGAQGNLDY